MALVACPTASIGTEERTGTAEASRAFPLTIEGEVSFCGYTSEKSFGAWSYFIERPGGNALALHRREQPVVESGERGETSVDPVDGQIVDGHGDRAVPVRRRHGRRGLGRPRPGEG